MRRGLGSLPVHPIKNLKHYFATHFAASFSLVLAVALLLVTVLQQTYLKKEYLRYLMEQNYETENAALESVQKNLKTAIREMIYQGGKMAVDEDIYDRAVSADAVLKENINVNNMTLNLYRSLQLYTYESNIKAAAVFRREGLITQYDKIKTSEAVLWSGDTQEEQNEILDSFFGEGRDTVFPRFRVFLDPRTHPAHAERGVFHIAYPLTGGKVSIWETDYLLVLSSETDMFQEYLKTVDMPDVEYIQGYIADQNGDIVYHSNRDLIGTQESLISGESSVTHISRDIGYFDWTLNVVIDKEKMEEHIDAIYGRSSAVYALLLIFGVAVIFIWFRRLMHPVRQLSQSMKHVEQGDYHSKIEIEGSHEVWQIAEEYNRMIEAIRQKNQEISRQHQETLLSIEEKHQAEREALESQINAHFICNTLGSINYEAMEEGNYKVSVLLKKLSNILRYTFDQKSQDVYIYQEIAWIDQYLYLQKYRLETVFDYEIRFPDLYGQWPCCRLMFQPFVENSILHGFEGRKQGGMIRISGGMEGELLKIVIEDNGCGMDPETERTIQKILRERGNLSLDRKETDVQNEKRQGIGIQNVVTRMRMYYGSRFEISLETQEGKGTKFIFLIPIPESIEA